jgi:lipopolysaccharide export system permease protein
MLTIELHLKTILGNICSNVLMFIPIGIIIDVSEKINFMIENKIRFLILLSIYHFTIYFANSLFPISFFIDYLVYLEIS